MESKFSIKSTLLMAALVSVFSIDASEASELRVVNEKQRSMVIKIIPEPTMSNDTVKEVEIPGSREWKFTVNPADINGKHLFAIHGHTVPLLGDTCRNLSVEKNYQLTFTDDAIGTSCYAVEK